MPRSRKRRFWTEDKVTHLRQLYPEHTAYEIAEILGTTPSSVYLQAFRLGLGKEQPSKIRLTDEQTRWLIKNFPHMSNGICALYLGIGCSTLSRIARNLELRKTPQFMAECQAYTAKKAQESHRKNGTYPPKGVYTPNLRKGEKYQFKPKSEAK